MRRPADREGWGDVAKGVGILTIIVTHVLLHDPQANTPNMRLAASLVAMPAFFVTSGLIFRPIAPGKLIQRRTRSILVPYIAFLSVVVLLVMARDIVLGGNSLPTVGEFLWGGSSLKGDFGTFWFLSSLFLTQVAYNALAYRYADPARREVIFLVAGILLAGTLAALVFPGRSLPFSLETLPFTIPLFWFGHLLQHEREHRRQVRILLIMIAVAALVAAMVGYRFRIALKAGSIEPPILGLLLGFLTAKLALTSYRLIARVPLISSTLAAVGQASLVLLCLHQWVHFTLRRVGVETSWIIISLACFLPYLAWIVMRQIEWVKIVFLGTRPPIRPVAAML
ncbi:MAG: acyltransferase family protein [Sphingobium sp.]